MLGKLGMRKSCRGIYILLSACHKIFTTLIRVWDIMSEFIISAQVFIHLSINYVYIV